MSLTRNTAIAIVVVLLTFAAGMAVGVFVSHIRILRSDAGAHRFPVRAMLHRLDQRLDLTDAQRAQVEDIIRRRHARIRELRNGLQPQIDAELERANAEIVRVLTPEQREEYAKMRMRMRRFGPPHHGPPHP